MSTQRSVDLAELKADLAELEELFKSIMRLAPAIARKAAEARVITDSRDDARLLKDWKETTEILNKITGDLPC